MAHFLVTYDVQKANPDPHSKILADSQSFGWYSYAQEKKGTNQRLPNTTLFGVFSNFNEAEEKFISLIHAARSKNSGILFVEKYVIVEYVNFTFFVDDSVKA